MVYYIQDGMDGNLETGREGLAPSVSVKDRLLSGPVIMFELH